MLFCGSGARQTGAIVVSFGCENEEVSEERLRECGLHRYNPPFFIKPQKHFQLPCPYSTRSMLELLMSSRQEDRNSDTADSSLENSE